MIVYQSVKSNNRDIEDVVATAYLSRTGRSCRTRKGCYIYCTDAETRAYLEGRLASQA